jgi:mannose-1-phosphate guanylyltransferase
MMLDINLTAAPIILCGGSCKCLWQLSRTHLPNQLFSSTVKERLFQQAAKQYELLRPNSYAVSMSFEQKSIHALNDLIGQIIKL